MRQRDCQHVPVLAGEYFREINDLSDVIAIVRHLLLDRPDDGLLFTVNEDGLAEVFRCEARQYVVQQSPTFIPRRHQFDAGLLLVLELGVTVPVRLLAVRRQKVGPARLHVVRDVLDDDRERERVLREHAMHVLLSLIHISEPTRRS